MRREPRPRTIFDLHFAGQNIGKVTNVVIQVEGQKPMRLDTPTDQAEYHVRKMLRRKQGQPRQ